MRIKLRRAGQKDSQDILAWRNDPLTRKISFNNKKVDLKEHARWYAVAIKAKDKLIYIGENDNHEKLGMARLDKLNRLAAEINVNIAPEMRGKGFGPALISLACKRSGLKMILARTKESNTPSVKAFLRARFLPFFDYKDLTGETVKVFIWLKNI